MRYVEQIVMRMQKNAFMLCCLIAAAPAVFCAAKSKRQPQRHEESASHAPVWFIDRTLAYSSLVYVSATGSGFSEAAARDDAAAQISMYFESRITVSRSSGMAVSGMGNFVSKSGYAAAETRIDSESVIPGILFTDVFWSGGKAHVCAYVNRDECAASFSSRIESILSRAASSIQSCRSKSASPAALSVLNSVRSELLSVQPHALHLSVLEPEKGADYQRAADKLFSECAELSEKIRSRLTFSVSIEGDRDGVIANVLKEILEEAGFSCVSEKKALYSVSGKITASESQNKIGFFVRPAVLLHISGGDSGALSYSRQYEKYGHTAMDAAYRKAYIEVEKDLRQNFIKAISSGD